jgi:polyisoprenoid-binding protein YceI
LNVPRILIGMLVLAVVAVGAAAAGWWFFNREDAELATNSRTIDDTLRTAIATSAAGSTPTAATTAASGTTPIASSEGALAFRIIPEQSTASYFADEKLASLPLPSKAQGTTKEIEGTFHLTENGFGLDPSQPSTFTVQLTSLKSDKDMRDRRVQSTLETGRFPSATFTATSISGVDTSLPADQEHTFQLAGMLDLHGVQKEVTWEVKARRDGALMTGLATVNFMYSDFGITPPNIANFVAVEDDVTLQVQIVAQAS